VQFRVGGVLRAAHVLHREAELLGVLAVQRRDVLEDIEQRRPVVPVQTLATVHDHVAVERRHGDEAHVGDSQCGGESQVVAPDPGESCRRVVHEVHLVHRDDDVWNADQVGQIGVAAGLRQHTLAGVDEDDGQVGGGRRGDHVAGVLLVARRVRNDVLARPGREVAVGDVDGDSLLAFGL